MSNYQLSSNKHLSYKGLSPRVSALRLLKRETREFVVGHRAEENAYRPPAIPIARPHRRKVIRLATAENGVALAKNADAAIRLYATETDGTFVSDQVVARPGRELDAAIVQHQREVVRQQNRPRNHPRAVLSVRILPERHGPRRARLRRRRDHRVDVIGIGPVEIGRGQIRTQQAS